MLQSIFAPIQRIIEFNSFTFLLNYEFIVILILSLSVQFIFINAPGTGDVGIWLEFMSVARRDGAIDGYINIGADYPPLSFAILKILTVIGNFFKLNDFLILKTALLFFTTASYIAAYIFTRNILISSVILITCIVSGVFLGYLDVLFSPLLILTFYFLSRGNTVASSLLFFISCLIKWQPLIISPFLLLYVWKNERSNFVKLIIVNLFMLLSLILIYGKAPLDALEYATSHDALSGNALNLMWLFGIISNIVPTDDISSLPSLLVPYSSKSLLVIIYCYLLWNCYRRALRIEDFIYYGIMGFFSYYILNYGVHENHLFVPAILAAVFYKNKSTHFLYGYIVAMSTINLIVFYGFVGSFDHQSSWFDRLTAIISAVNVVVFVRQIILEILPLRRNGPYVEP